MADKPARGERDLWQLSRDEQRILLITFVGGVASIVVGAAIIGAALALARLEHRIGSSWVEIAELAFAAVLATAAYLSKAFRSIADRRLLLFAALGALLLWSILILWLVGIAAGIH